MPEPNPAALDFLMTRRSRPAKTLVAPWPTRGDLLPLLTAAARSPDHGKLEPWRFVVLQGAALRRLADAASSRGLDLGLDADAVAKGVDQFARSGCAVAVIASPKPSDKVPEFEQILSAGAVCLALLNAALAAGWGANWLTGWPAHDPEFGTSTLRLGPTERVAGFVHLGTETAPPPDRPRPDLDAITTWAET